jgi:hypothetical protein
MQKKWRKKLKQAERAQQSKRKAERLAKLRDPKAKSGFRKIHIGTDVYLWRYFGGSVEVRIPTGDKWVVPIWELQGHSESEWIEMHSECYEDCAAYAVAPSMVRDYINAKLRLC